MRKLITKSFLALLGLIMFANFAMAQVNMNRWIELTVQQGEQIRLGFIADAENTPVMVKSGDRDTTFNVEDYWYGPKLYYAETGTMKVYGNICGFACMYNRNKILELNFSNNTGLTILDCQGNNLYSLDLSGLTALKALDCQGNNLSACGLDSIFHQLPRREKDDKGYIYIKEVSETNPGTYFCRDTIATNRNWWVLDGNIPIVNTTYACPDFSIKESDFSVIEEISANSINIYPNPASNNLNIECEEKIDNLELYDALGRMLISKENVLDNTSIDVSNLESGMYILKIRTENGSGEYKVIVE